MTLHDWANLSIVILSIEGIVLVAVTGLVLYYCIRVTNRAMEYLRSLMPTLGGYARVAATVTEGTSQQIANPLIALSAFQARLKRMARASVAPRLDAKD